MTEMEDWCAPVCPPIEPCERGSLEWCCEEERPYIVIGWLGIALYFGLLLSPIAVWLYKEVTGA